MTNKEVLEFTIGEVKSALGGHFTHNIQNQVRKSVTDKIVASEIAKVTPTLPKAPENVLVKDNSDKYTKK